MADKTTKIDGSDVEKVTLSIDGQEVTVPQGTTLLQAAQGAGTEVPHYCYHPGLSSPAMCRLCLVEVEGAPKLLPSCTTTVAEGQVVRTQSDNATRMRRGVLEFYLLNHPLDCPICDQSGECDLQDFVFAEGREHGRGRDAKRVLGRDDFGGDVLFYGDRCVMCTRCVRFMEEVEEKPLLTVVERGSRSVIDTFFDKGLEQAEWAGNVVDICPVGALVSKDFLHRARAWDLDHTPSICPNCSQGCNIELHTRDNLVHRMKPRTNPEVNGHWICDYGRGRYEWLNRGDRLEAPVMHAEGRKTAMGWTEALEALKARVDTLRASSVKAVVSPFWSNEDLGAVSRLVRTLGDGAVVFRSPRADEEVALRGYEGLARRKGLAPNEQGAELLGCERVGDDAGQGGLDDFAEYDGVVLVLGDALDDQPEGFAPNAALVLYVGAYTSAALASADFQLPVTTFAEQEGTFTNHVGRVQRFWPALSGPGAARPAWLVLGALLGAIQDEEGPRSAEQAFGLVADVVESYRGLDYETIGAQGGRPEHGYPWWRTDVNTPIAGLPLLLASSLKVAIMFGVVMLTVAYTTLAERRISAFIQDRLGPNRVGPFGLLQPIADGLKNLVKEEALPGAASKFYFMLGPMLAMVPALVTFAVVPFAAPLPTPWGVVDMIIADVPIGLLYILALSSLGVYGIVIGGWASNNKYAFLGALRASAQMVSYEVALGLSLIVVIMMAGSVTLTEIVWQQQQLGLWFALPLSLGFILFVVSAFAETNRLPFDMPEAESELITGFHTEYSAMKFSMFFIAEYAHMLTAAALMATLFFGGWDLPGSWDDAFWFQGELIRGFDASGAPIAAAPAIWKTLLTFAGFAAKTGFFLVFYIWVRWTLPRFRYDQVMQLGWKIMLPTALAYIMIVSTTILVLDQVGVSRFTHGLALTGVSAICTVAFVFFLDRGRIIEGAAVGYKAAASGPSAGGQGVIVGEGATAGD